MPNEKQIEAPKKVASVVLPALDPFGHRYVKPAGVNLHKRNMKQYGWIMDHEHCRKTVTGENIEDLDLYALTQAYKNECGMEMMKQLLASGQATVADFADDGTLSGDNTLPQDINTLHAVFQEEAAANEKVLERLGGTSDALNKAIAEGNLEGYIKGLINAQLAVQQAAQSQQTEESK